MPSSIASDDVYDAFPERPCGTAVLLLAGSSGRLESARADLLGHRGARVRAIRWFGGIGQRPAPHEVPIEMFIDQIELLRRDHDRVAIFGTSFGAEAALVTASTVEIDATIAVSPSSVVWSGLAEGRWSSHWTLGGSPLPAVVFDPAWTPVSDPPEYLSLYSTSLTPRPGTHCGGDDSCRADLRRPAADRRRRRPRLAERRVHDGDLTAPTCPWQKHDDRPASGCRASSAPARRGPRGRRHAHGSGRHTARGCSARRAGLASDLAGPRPRSGLTSGDRGGDGPGIRPVGESLFGNEDEDRGGDERRHAADHPDRDVAGE